MSHAAGLPSHRIQPTERENFCWYNTLGNRGAAPSRTAKKTQQCTSAVFKRIMYTKKEDTVIDKQGLDGRLECRACVSVSLERFRGSNDSKLYLLECEVDGIFSGDIYPMQTIRKTDDLKHNPYPYPVREGGKDHLTLQLNPKTRSGEASKNGSAEWRIPVYVIRYQSDAPGTVILPDGSDIEQTIIESGGTIVHKACIVQKFVLQNSVLAVSKGNTKIDSVDLTETLTLMQ